MTRTLLFLIPLCWAAAGFGGESEFQIPNQVDQLIEARLQQEGVEPSAIVSDEDFLRRANLDLAGVVPSTEQIAQFLANPDVSKRANVIDDLVNSPEFAEHWAGYWQEVIFSRATEQRTQLAQPAFHRWMEQQLTENRSWDQIVTAMITAKGDVTEHGETALIFAQSGEPEEVAAEVSRIFLGIQLSCANCHDHPTDSWKRDQFHRLAAYLPRIVVRRENLGDKSKGEKPTFVVTSRDDLPNRGEQKVDVEQVLRRLDRNHDGKLSKAEARGPLAKRFDQIVKNFDRDKDGLLSKAELGEARELANVKPGRGKLEHFMSDLNNPASEGTLMQPEFFLAEVSGPKLKQGVSDSQRRNTLAKYVTSPSNPWFAKAFVNRIWGELIGQGFFMPIDDMGPERTATDEEVLTLLANEFTAHHYDIKWLYRTIALTKTYQRQLRHVPADGSAPAFASATATRLRADQIYNSIFEVLGLPEGTMLTGRIGRVNQMRLEALGIDPQRRTFNELFGFDPSTPQEDLLGNVPQALFMMNSPQLDGLIKGHGKTRLAEILAAHKDDEEALKTLYLTTFSREPTAKEIEINLEYIKQVNTRNEAFEDILWSLLNSTEFLSKR